METIAPKVQREPDVIDLEPELIEGDAPISKWIWFVVALVILFGVIFAPFELF